MSSKMSHLFAYISPVHESLVEDLLSHNGPDQGTGWAGMSTLDTDGLGLAYYVNAGAGIDFLPDSAPNGPRPILYRSHCPNDPPPPTAAFDPAQMQWSLPLRPGPRSASPPASDAPPIMTPTDSTAPSMLSTPMMTPFMTPSTSRLPSPGARSRGQARRFRGEPSEAGSRALVEQTRTRALLACTGLQLGGTGSAPETSDLMELVRRLPTYYGINDSYSRVRTLEETRDTAHELHRNVRRAASTMVNVPPTGNGRGHDREERRRTLFKHILADMGGREPSQAKSRVTKDSDTAPAIAGQPFVYGQYAAVVCGVVGNLAVIAPEISREYMWWKGDRRSKCTSAELVAAMLMVRLGGRPGRRRGGPLANAKDMARALSETMGELMWQQQMFLGRKAQANSLIAVTTNGQELVAMRFRNHAVDQPPELYYSTSTGASNRGRRLDEKSPKSGPDGHGEKIFVTSEPGLAVVAEWELLEKNSMLLVDSSGSMAVRPVEYPLGMNSKVSALD